MNKKGAALIIGFMVVTVLTILGGAIVMRGVSESQNVQRQAQSTQAFWLAEAGINRALDELRSSYSATGSNLWSSSLDQGNYAVNVADITINGQSCKRVTATGTVNAQSRSVEAIMSKFIPPNFFDNAIYSAGEVNFNGNSYSLTGDIRYAGSIDNTGNVNGTITQDASISPLALLDFSQLLSKSETQNNVYEYVGPRLKNTTTGSENFPSSFWYTRADDGLDNDSDSQTDEADEWVPNVIYVNGDLTLNGNIGAIGGFFVVAGDVINTPDITQDATINGNGMIEGVIYTRGEFRINGGGGNLNINGGVWAGEAARLNGNSNITYNQSYMDAIEGLNINADVQISSWRDTQNPYGL